MLDGVPFRTDGAGPAAEAQRSLPLVRGGRPLKRWRYVGAYGPQLMVCAASVRIGPLGQSFLAVWDRERQELADAFSFRAGTVHMGPGVVRAHTRRVTLDLRTDEQTSAADAVEVQSLHAGQPIWTRKQPVRVRGTVRVDGVPRAFDAPGLIDDSAGYHARVTEWEWSAGVGENTDGQPVAWNLVQGLHDAAAGSERTVWVDGRAHEVAPVRFLDDLGGCSFAEGGELRCAAEAERARHDRLLVVSSDYRQPFGAFSGTLPGGGALAAGFGVMERHRVRW